MCWSMVSTISVAVCMTSSVGGSPIVATVNTPSLACAIARLLVPAKAASVIRTSALFFMVIPLLRLI
ncbi:hypothetical protein D3C71_1832450 [compost metagenome]